MLQQKAVAIVDMIRIPLSRIKLHKKIEQINMTLSFLTNIWANPKLNTKERKAIKKSSALNCYMVEFEQVGVGVEVQSEFVLALLVIIFPQCVAGIQESIQVLVTKGADLSPHIQTQSCGKWVKIKYC